MEEQADAQHMSDKEQFCRSFEWTASIAWSAEQGIVMLDDDRRAVITMRVDINGDAGDMHVDIVHKKTGVIVGRTFCFGDYLSKDMAHRKDQRSDYTGAPHAKRLGRPLRWYIAEPKTTTPFTRAVEAYIDVGR
jgi:hypothetical protein